jgi:hypothetical protein
MVRYNVGLLIAIAAISSLTGCTGNGGTRAAIPIPVQLSNKVEPSHGAGRFACPRRASLKYVSDYNNNVINVYSGNFAGQSACGVLTSGLSAPWGLYVDASTHDLYVANDLGHDVLVFHRGSLTAYDTYTDPTFQDPVDVVVLPDGTVVATNLEQGNRLEDGSLSTWLRGSGGGTFVGNFPMTNGGHGLYVAARSDGTVYFDKLNGQTNVGSLWSVSCPLGVCGVQTEVQGVTFNGPGGLAFDSGGDLRADDALAGAETYELPRTKPKTFSVLGAPTGLAINAAQHHWFIADGLNDQAEEYLYPGGTLIGVVSGNVGGGTMGIAVDP